MKIPTARKLPSGSWFMQPRIGGKSIPITASTEKAAIAQAMAYKAGIQKIRRNPEKMALGMPTTAIFRTTQSFPLPPLPAISASGTIPFSL